jgi:hypothetical protein
MWRDDLDEKPRCRSSSTMEREGRMAHGFRRLTASRWLKRRCRNRGRRRDERTGTVLDRVITLM